MAALTRPSFIPSNQHKFKLPSHILKLLQKALRWPICKLFIRFLSIYSISLIAVTASPFLSTGQPLGLLLSSLQPLQWILIIRRSFSSLLSFFAPRVPVHVVVLLPLIGAIALLASIPVLDLCPLKCSLGGATAVQNLGIMISGGMVLE